MPQMDFREILNIVREHSSHKYASILIDKPEEQKEQILEYIKRIVLDHEMSDRDGSTLDELVNKIYTEMVEFSFLTKYLYAKNVEEININSWKDIKVIYNDGTTETLKDHFDSPQNSIDVVRKLLQKSDMILDRAQSTVRGHLNNQIRITVFGPPVIDKENGVAASIRIVNPQKLKKEDFLKKGTATEEMLNDLSLFLRFGVSMCITGATGSGKTTLMSWIMSSLPYDKRIFTIEIDTREFDLIVEDEDGNVLNDVVHTVTHYSDDKRENVDAEKLLEYALTSNPDVICVGEMKSAEAFSAQEAARTGHAVITTTHANSCEETYSRMRTLCKQKYDLNDKTLDDMVTEAFPIVVFVKQLEDNTRRIMEITEMEILSNGERKLRTLYRYNIYENKKLEDGKIKTIGEFEKVHNISSRLQRRLLENGMPRNIMQSMIGDEVLC